MQQRYYDPVIGEFLSTDAVAVDSVTASNFCRYCYADNNPYRFTDPDGRQAADLRAIALQAKLAGKDVQQVRTAEMRPVGEAWNAAGATLGKLFLSQFSDGPGGAVAGTAAMARGVANEARVLEAMGEAKNTEKVVTSQGNSIQDFQNVREVGEIKDTQRVSNTTQIRAQREHAQATGREHTVVTGTNTKVSSTVEKQSNVIRRDDLGPPLE